MLKKNLIMIIIASLMGLLIPTLSFSKNILTSNQEGDSLIWITETQLRQTNIMFLEHEKLLKRDSLLSQQVLHLEQAYINYNKIDSLRKIQLSNAREQIKKDSVVIDDMNKKIIKSKKKIKNRNYAISILSGLLLLIGYAAIK